MLKRMMLAAMMTGMVVVGAWAAPKKAQTLKPGKYNATAKAVVCSACAAEIEKTLKGFPGVEGVTVVPEGGGVRFKVKKAVKLDDLQKALRADSDKMGMGADYTLRDIKLVSSNTPKS